MDLVILPRTLLLYYLEVCNVLARADFSTHKLEAIHPEQVTYLAFRQTNTVRLLIHFEKIFHRRKRTFIFKRRPIAKCDRSEPFLGTTIRRRRRMRRDLQRDDTHKHESEVLARFVSCPEPRLRTTMFSSAMLEREK